MFRFNQDIVVTQSSKLAGCYKLTQPCQGYLGNFHILFLLLRATATVLKIKGETFRSNYDRWRTITILAQRHASTASIMSLFKRRDHKIKEYNNSWPLSLGILTEEN
jgi:hypothetical protein